MLNILDTAEGNGVQHSVLQRAEEDDLLDLIGVVILPVSAAQHTATNDEFLGVIFAPDDEEILLEVSHYPASNIGDCRWNLGQR